MVVESKTERMEKKIYTELGAINDLLKDPSVIDIMYNPSGDLYVERYGVGIVKETINYSPHTAYMLICSVASYNDTSCTDDAPLLSALLPGGQRFQGFTKPAVSSPAFSIRCNRSMDITLDDYVADGALLPEYREYIHNALAKKENIILSGSTGSGKTTFCSGCMNELYMIAPDDRVIIMEDVPEMQIKHHNVVKERKTPTCSYSDLLAANLRANPDRIILGESRGGEAYDLLTAWNTGHPGGVTTLHANSAESALTRFAGLVLKNPEAQQLNLLAIRSEIAEAVDVVVHIARKAGCKPKVTEIIKLDKQLNLDGTYKIERIL